MKETNSQFYLTYKGFKLHGISNAAYTVLFASGSYLGTAKSLHAAKLMITAFIKMS